MSIANSIHQLIRYIGKEIKTRNTPKPSRRRASLLTTFDNNVIIELFENMFQSACNAIVLLERERVIDCNPKALEIFGGSREAIIGKTLFEFSPTLQPDGQKSNIHAKELYNNIFKEKNYHFEWLHKKINGELFLANVNANPFIQNNRRFILVTIYDITQQKKEHEELQHYRDNLEQQVNEKTILLEEQNQELKTLNEELDLVNSNLSISNAELLDANNKLLNTNAMVQTSNQRLEQAIKEHKETIVEKTLLEEKYKQFIFQSSNGILLINTQGIIEEWNHSMAQITGISHQDAVGDYIWNITYSISTEDDKQTGIAKQFKQDTINFVHRISKGEIKSYTFETHIKSTDQTSHYIHITLFPITTINRTYAGAVVTDITQQKNTEIKLSQYQKELEELLLQKAERLTQLSDHFNELYANTSEAITFLDILEDGKLLKIFDMNVAAQKLFSISEDKIKEGAYAFEHLSENKYSELNNNIHNVIKTGKPITINHVADVTQGYWQSTITPIKNKKGKVYRVVVFSKNITAEHEKEELTNILQSAIDSWPFEFWARDIEGRQILQNSVSRKEVGNMIGTRIDEMNMPPEKQQQTKEIAQRVLKGESLSIEYTQEIGGKILNKISKLNPILANNKVIGYTCLNIDITERKQAEEKLKASEEQYRLLAENIEDVIFKMNPKTQRFTYQSPSSFKLRGYTIEEGKKHSLHQVLMPESFNEIEKEIPRRIKEFEKGKAEERVKKYELYLRHKNGQSICAEIMTTLLTDSEGKVTEILGVTRNIDERKRAEAKIKQQSELHQTILDTVNVGLIYVKNRKVEWANSSFYNMYGYSHDEAIATIALYAHQEDYNEIGKVAYKQFAMGQIYVNEYQSVKKDGSLFWIYLSGKAINAEQTDEGTIWMIQDITNRKKAELDLKNSETLLKATIESISDGIMVVMFDWQITLVNTHLKEIFSIPDDQFPPLNYSQIFNDAKQLQFNPEEYALRIAEIYQTNQPSHDILHLTNERIIERFSYPLTEENPLKGRVWLYRDITESKKAEEALIKSQKLLSDSQRVAHIGSWEYIFKEDKLIWNEGAYQIHGYDSSETQNTIELYFKLIHPDDLEYVKSKFTQTIKDKEFPDYEYRIIRPDGTIRNILIIGAVATDCNGNVIKTSGIVQDITDRKIAEAYQHENEERLRLITHLSKYMVYEYDINTGNIKWDGAIKEVTGYTNEDYNGFDFNYWCEAIHPDDRNKTIEEFKKSVNHIKPFKAQYRYHTKEKGYRWIEEESYVLPESDKIPGRVLGIMKDITDHREIQQQIIESEQKLRTIFGVSKDGIVLLNKEMIITDVNASIVNKSSYNKEMLIGMDIRSFLPEYFISEFEHIVEMIFQGEITENFETLLKASDSKIFPVEISATAIHLNTQDLILLVVRDISERKEFERQLLNSVIHTEERERLYFSQELHDGLGPLLSAAKIYLDWMEKPDANITKEELIPDIKKLLEEASYSIREISFKLSPHILQNYGLVEATKAFCDKVNESSNIQIELTAHDIIRLGEIIETILYRVLCECINNTLKHAHAKKIDITMDIIDSELQVRYHDDGRGFDVEKAFATRKGIGLLNMQSRIKSINGQFTIVSQQGNGTNILVNINLPANKQ